MYCSLKNGWKKYQVRLWLSIFFTCYIPNSFILEFSGCSASYNHSSDNNCLKAIDGSTNDGVNSWGTDIFPAWAIFELKEEKKMNSIVLMSGSATACWALLLSFKVTLEVDGQWIQLNGLQVKGGHKCGCFHNYCGSPQPPTAQIETDGTVTFPDNSPGFNLHPWFWFKDSVLFLPYKISGASYTPIFSGYFLATPDFYKAKKIVIRQR